MMNFSYIWLKQHRMIVGAMLFAIAIAIAGCNNSGATRFCDVGLEMSDR